MGELLRAGGKFSHRWFGETGRLFLWIFYKWSLKALISYCVCAACLVGQSCLTLCDSVDYSPPGFSVHEILQARILEWAAIPFSRGSSPPRDQTWVSCIGRQIQTPEINPCIYANWYLTKVPKIHNGGERVCLKMLRKLDVNMQRNEIGTLSYKKST